ncbi:hypothetical protein M0R45_030512 [Rubus argutus]|uniref:Jacalin-type lectin domain-containing protein n=1 Tax=Rubus argutus TaxID=59490 RepID=A0AAW1WB94_RUBAR
MALIEERRYVVSTRFGGTGGSQYWDDGLYHGVREITLHFNTHINSIAVGYYKNGENINAEKHGGDGGNPITITLAADEFIKNVSGYIVDGTHWGTADYVIRSLKFQSNIREYGPYGDEEGNPFTFIVNPGDKIIGFFGRNGSHLDAIGFHVALGIPHP